MGGIPNVMGTGRSGMMTARAAVATAGHNIANANAEGFSRQRVHQSPYTPEQRAGGQFMIGQGSLISRVERINDEYLEKQIRNTGRDVAHSEEKEFAFRQIEDLFNEVNGEGMSQLMARFFNEFRKLANDPDGEAVRQSVREASNAVINDFRRLRREAEEVRKHIDSRLEGYVREINTMSEDIRDLNLRIKTSTIAGASPNDLLDKRDVVLKNLASYVDLTVHNDGEGAYVVDIKGVGPLITGGEATKFTLFRSRADGQGKPEGAYDVGAVTSSFSAITHQLKGGKLGALLDIRDKSISTILDRLDDLAYTVVDSVNRIHEQGFSRNGTNGIKFFKALDGKARAAEFMELSDDVRASVNNIATAAVPGSPGDNRIALAISGLQGLRVMNEGRTTIDDFFNSIVSEIGVAGAHNRAVLNQHRDIFTQLSKMRDQVSGVSIDEETANLMQFQHAYDASAKVIQVADEMLKTILNLRS